MDTKALTFMQIGEMEPATTNNRSVPTTRTIGFWLAVIMAALQAFNAWRAFTDPSGFAAYMGLPLTDGADPAFVLVYGLRTLFIAGLITAFLALRNLDALAWMALVALIMPIGDAWLTAQAGAPTVIVFRHVAIALYVLLAFFFLRRAVERTS